jgi:hypothetical protein
MARAPENAGAVTRAVVTSPRRSATKHATALSNPDRSVERILQLHSYKMMVMQEFQEHNWANCIDLV